MSKTNAKTQGSGKTSTRSTATSRPVAKTTIYTRDAQGRFSSPSAVVRTSKVKNALKSANKTTSNSSFIQNMTVNSDGTVTVVMYRNPKTVYTYKPTVKGAAKIQSALKNGGSLGSVYNSELKGREISRTIYK
jgi:hypothetical protein